MSDFKEELRILTDKEKSRLYADILRKHLHSGKVSSREKIAEEVLNNKKYQFSPDEIIAIATLSSEMTIYQVTRSRLLLSPTRKRKND